MPALPSTMRAWVLDGPAGAAMEEALRLVPDHPVPEAFQNVARGETAPGDPPAVVVRVLYAALNPADYKIPELPLVGRFVPRRPMTPAMDFCGRVVAATAPGLAPGTLVAGKTADVPQHGALAEYVLAPAAAVVAVPAGVRPAHAATVAIAGTTAWGALAPAVRAAQAAAAPGRTRPVHVFVNGGAGGVGVYAVQIAKALGCSVTATCSTPNVALLRRLGADRVIDYRTEDPGPALTALATAGPGPGPGPGPVDVALDLVGHAFALYKAADGYLAPAAPYVLVGFQPAAALHILLRPAWLRGGRRRAPAYRNAATPAGLRAVVGYLADGRLTVPLEKEAALEDVPAAYALLRTTRVRGKIVVRVAEDDDGGAERRTGATGVFIRVAGPLASTNKGPVV